jgi:hypothetical protein
MESPFSFTTKSKLVNLPVLNFRVRLEGWLWGSAAPYGLKFVFGVIFSSLSPARTLLKAAHGLAPLVRQKMA